MKRIGILTSGGDSPGMNAAIRAATRSGIYKNFEIIGFERGFDGLIQGYWKCLSTASVSEIIRKGGTILKTARSKEFMTVKGLQKALHTLHSLEIDSLIIIGGDGSFRGASSLSAEGIHVIGIPGTIDNDLNYTDFTIGFDTALNTVVSSIEKIIDTSLSHECNTIIEVMGRKCGDLALYSGICTGADQILIPEEEMSLEAIVQKINVENRRGKLQSMIVKAEGYPMETTALARAISQETGTETRSAVLGYLQRGGEPTAADRLLASQMGMEAIRLISDGVKNRCIGIQNNSLLHLPIDEAIHYKKRYDGSLMHLAQVLSI